MTLTRIYFVQDIILPPRICIKYMCIFDEFPSNGWMWDDETISMRDMMAEQLLIIIKLIVIFYLSNNV